MIHRLLSWLLGSDRYDEGWEDGYRAAEADFGWARKPETIEEVELSPEEARRLRAEWTAPFPRDR